MVNPAALPRTIVSSLGCNLASTSGLPVTRFRWTLDVYTQVPDDYVRQPPLLGAPCLHIP